MPREIYEDYAESFSSFPPGNAKPPRKLGYCLRIPVPGRGGPRRLYGGDVIEFRAASSLYKAQARIDVYNVSRRYRKFRSREVRKFQECSPLVHAEQDAINSLQVHAARLVTGIAGFALSRKKFRRAGENCELSWSRAGRKKRDIRCIRPERSRRGKKKEGRAGERREKTRL